MAKLESHDGYYLWLYLPSIPAAVIFLILFILITGGHMWKMFRNRMWFCIPMVIGGFCEIIGYIGRAIAHNNTADLGPYVMQSTLLLIAPVLFAATLYMVYSHLVRGIDAAKYSFITPRWTTIIFVTSDIFCIFIQGGGSGIMVKDDGYKTGKVVVIIGLILQIVAFGLFVVICRIFHTRYNEYESRPNSSRVDFPWRKILMMLYLTSSLILLRNIFRVVEFAMDHDGYLQANEWPTYIFDSVPMFIVMVVFFWWYPVMTSRESGYTTPAEYPMGNVATVSPVPSASKNRNVTETRQHGSYA